MGEPVREIGAGEKAEVNRVVLDGRIDTMWRHGDLWHTVLTLPAPTEYDRPSAVLVKTKHQLGQPGDKWRGVCHVGGYAKKVVIKSGQRQGETFYDVISWFYE